MPTPLEYAPRAGPTVHPEPGFDAIDWVVALGASIPLWVAAAAAVGWARAVGGRQPDGTWYSPDIPLI
ncbi:MAG: hypothetical protein JWO31_1241 [Phycisphaerales bacterium]|nr:hypothetical protein [Phycisphaerales bacterium]